jgi:hypothetical protein
MNSSAPLPAHRVDHASSHALADCAQQHKAASEPTAQNGRPDPKLRIEPTEADDFRSPLWAVAIGTACLFTAMAAVLAFGSTHEGIISAR